ncbi:MAG: primosomal replication protein N [Zoogloeaceae bacterium]|nr:primosomal replication protein N [Zoogloeaceae bacterium]
MTGRLAEKKPLRYTPAGIPVAEGRILHQSEQTEAGTLRQTRCEISALALGETANWLNATPLGVELRLSGFLTAKSHNSKTLVLHVQTIDFLEGKENGSILQEKRR